MMRSLLVANRGEIARRIFRTARRLGIGTIAVFSEADALAPHVREADQAVFIGPSPASESYLAAESILQAARDTGAEAIHPGYGFLSENADFAEAVIAAGLVWVGPPPRAIRAMGLKDAAKALMIQAGVPVTPGYLGEDQAPERLAVEADLIGWPVLIKAVAGGGGKGMRRVDHPAEFSAALTSCRREAAASFGDDRVLIEKYVTRPRHIEVQVFADRHGNTVHLFERDCSLQRRHQKVIEEAPAPGMDETTRAAVCGAAVKAAAAVEYEGAGTIEFIADASEGLRPDRIWFMEMNTRLQVEHPVTEAITGEDLVEWQLRVAAGERLPRLQPDIRRQGHAIEARLYAENAAAGFLPSTGPLTRFALPRSDVRVDSGVEEGGEVTAFYDPMVAKLIAHAATRQAAAASLARACATVQVWPVKTNAGFLGRCLRDEDFLDGAVDTGFIAARLERLLEVPPPSPEVLRLAASGFLQRQTVGSKGPSPLGFRLNAPSRSDATVRYAGAPMVLPLGPRAGDAEKVFSEGRRVVVFHQGDSFAFEPLTREADAGLEAVGDGAIRSPMPGKVVVVGVAVGERVAKGQVLLTMEAMKMEHSLAAPFEGRVETVNATAGAQVPEGLLLVELSRAP